jgi:hypothetical protein
MLFKNFEWDKFIKFINFLYLKFNFGQKRLWSQYRGLGFGLDERWIWILLLAETSFFFLLSSALTTSETHPAFYAMGSKGCF